MHQSFPLFEIIKKLQSGIKQMVQSLFLKWLRVWGDTRFISAIIPQALSTVNIDGYLDLREACEVVTSAYSGDWATFIWELEKYRFWIPKGQIQNISDQTIHLPSPQTNPLTTSPTLWHRLFCTESNLHWWMLSNFFLNSCFSFSLSQPQLKFYLLIFTISNHLFSQSADCLSRIQI